MNLRKQFTNELIRLAEEDDKIILLTGDLGFNVLEPFIEKFPERYINCGITECNMIGVAAGLALGGYKPYVYSNQIFLVMRAYEFIRDEICFNNLDVKLIGTGASGFLGFSHNLVDNENINDLLKNLPNIKVYNPTESGLNTVLKSIGSAFIKI